MQNYQEILQAKYGIDTTITFLNSSNREVRMDIVAFGKGSNSLVLIPGLSDGFSTVKGKFNLLRWSYNIFFKYFRVLVISRPLKMPEKYSIEEMAEDYFDLLTYIGCKKISIWGVSMGGMIAQWIGIKHPEFVNSMCLDVTTAKTSNTTKEILQTWISYAKEKKHKELIIDTMKKTYTKEYLDKNKILLPLILYLTKIRSYDRFIIQAYACIDHNTIKLLQEMKVPCLITGGNEDFILGKGNIEELASIIKNSKIKIYDGFGHGSFEENKGHNKMLLDFFSERSIG